MSILDDPTMQARFSRYSELLADAAALGKRVGEYGEPFGENAPTILSNFNVGFIRKCVERIIPVILQTRKILEEHEIFGDKEFEWNDMDNKCKLIHFEAPNKFGISYVCQNFKHLLVVEEEDGKVKKVDSYQYFDGIKELTEEIKDDIKYSGKPTTPEAIAKLVLQYSNRETKYADEHYHGFTLPRLIKAINEDERFYHSQLFTMTYNGFNVYASLLKDEEYVKKHGKEHLLKMMEDDELRDSKVYTLMGLYSLFLDISCTLQNLKDDFKIPDEDEIEE